MPTEVETFLDTNVLIYAVSSAADEAHEKTVARSLLQRDDWGFSVQVLQEFYVNVTGKLKKTVTLDDPMSLIRRLMTRPIAPTTPDLFLQAVELGVRYKISYWDAAIVAAAVSLGCRTLYTQDLNSGQEYAGVTAVDPFRSTDGAS